MIRLADLQRERHKPETPFHRFPCDGCGKLMREHFIFRPDTYAEVRGASRQPDGIVYCRSDGLSRAMSYHQRELRNTMHAGA